MGTTVVDLQTIRVICPPVKAWKLVKELDGVQTTLTVASADMSTLVADSGDAEDFDDSASAILGDWYDAAADITPTSASLTVRHQAFVNRLRSSFSDLAGL